MLSDQELKARLIASTAHLSPDLEAELESVFRRAERRRWTRWTAYAIGVAAAVTLAVMLVRHDWSGAERPDPVEEAPVRTAVPGRGVFSNPAPIEPGLWNVRFLDHTAIDPYLQVDVPPGWGQDDDVALATGAPEDRTARGLSLSADMAGVFRGPCSDRTMPVGDTALEQARALASMPRVRAGPVEPISLDDYPGYQVSLRPSAKLQGGGRACDDGVALLYKTRNWPSFVALGWTVLVRLVDVDGHVLLVNAAHGPDASEADIAELFRMVDTAKLADP